MGRYKKVSLNHDRAASLEAEFGAHVGFDWDKIEKSDVTVGAVAVAVAAALRWVVGPYLNVHRSALRALVLTLVVDPHRFSHLSNRALAKALDVHETTFTAALREARSLMGVKGKRVVSRKGR